MHRRQLLTLILSVLSMSISMLASAPAGAEPAETLTVAAANSLRDALRNILPLFENQHPGVNVRVVYGPSQTLRDQITQGAPVDVFLPSLFEEIEQLEKKGLVIPGTTHVYAGTSVVLITSAAVPAPVRNIQDLSSATIRRIAVGDPKTSSVGKVAVQFLKNSRLEPRLKSQYVYGEHSRAVLELVAQGEAEVGVVYRTDAVANPNVRILDTAPPGSHNVVRYGVATVWTSRNISAARDFIDFLATPPVQAALEKYGFDRLAEHTNAEEHREVQQ